MKKRLTVVIAAFILLFLSQPSSAGSLSDEAKKAVVTYTCHDACYQPEQRTVNAMGKEDIDAVQKLPVPDFYAAGADLLNIEFDRTDESACFSVFEGDVKKTQSPVDKRVFTLSYDFKTPLTIMIADGFRAEAKYTVDPSAVSRNVLIWGDDYYYTVSSGVQSGSSGIIRGSFVNIAAGEALSSDGTVYRLFDGGKQRRIYDISIMDTHPLYEFVYKGCLIKTYKHFSTVEQQGIITFRDFRMFVKNGMLTVTDAWLPMVSDGIIIDTTYDKEYLTVLGEGGTLTDLKHPIKLPHGLKNEGIVQMSAGMESAKPYAAVRCRDGSVTIFDYLTGEQIAYDAGCGGVLLAGQFEGDCSTKMAGAAQAYSLLDEGIAPDKRYVAVFDINRAEYAVYDQASMLGIVSGKAVTLSEQQSKPKPPYLNIIKVEPKTVMQEKAYFAGGIGEAALVLLLIAAAVMTVLSMFDKRQRKSNGH